VSKMTDITTQFVTASQLADLIESHGTPEALVGLCQTNTGSAMYGVAWVRGACVRGSTLFLYGWGPCPDDSMDEEVRQLGLGGLSAAAVMRILRFAGDMDTQLMVTDPDVVDFESERNTTPWGIDMEQPAQSMESQTQGWSLEEDEQCIMLDYPATIMLYFS